MKLTNNLLNNQNYVLDLKKKKWLEKFYFSLFNSFQRDLKKAFEFLVLSILFSIGVFYIMTIFFININSYLLWYSIDLFSNDSYLTIIPFTLKILIVPHAGLKFFHILNYHYYVKKTLFVYCNFVSTEKLDQNFNVLVPEHERRMDFLNRNFIIIKYRYLKNINKLIKHNSIYYK